jgi:cytidyltransferase-like protein
MKRIYCDGIFDLFHSGHLKHFEKIVNQLKEPIVLIAGVISDKVATSYKRKPIVNETKRLRIVNSCVYIDEAFITDVLVMTEDFLNKHRIDFVVHGFTPEDRKKQHSFFEIPMKLGKFIELDYHEGISTTALINKPDNLTITIRHENIIEILSKSIELNKEHIIGEFGYEDNLLSSFFPNYYSIDLDSNTNTNHINIFIETVEKMFKTQFFDYIIVNNIDKYKDHIYLINEFKRITKKGVYISNIQNIHESIFKTNDFKILQKDTLCKLGYDALYICK